MPDKRRVSLAPVNTRAPSGISSLTRGGRVVEDLDGETVFGQRGGRAFQALGGHRVGELGGGWRRSRGGHAASWTGHGSQPMAPLTGPTTQPAEV
jgi:hypothetical protein